MAKSPGHQKWPEHQVREVPLAERITATIDGHAVADSTRTIRVDEDGHPPRYYFPREDVRMPALSRTDKTTHCPFKGDAHYFSLAHGGQTYEDAVWTYEEPYDEHQALKDRLAFDSDKVKGLRIGQAAAG
jgi:uncharacterized protein (DUF427 family)